MRRHAPRPGRSSTTSANSELHPDDDDANYHPRRRRLGALVPAPLMGSGTLGPLRWSAPYDSGTRHDVTTRLVGPSRKRPPSRLGSDTQKCRRSDLLSSSPCLPLHFRETAAARRRGAHISRGTATKTLQIEPTQHSTTAPQHRSTAAQQQPQRR